MRGTKSPLLTIPLTVIFFLITTTKAHPLYKKEIVSEITKIKENNSFIVEEGNCKYLAKVKGKIDISTGDKILIKGYFIPLKAYRNPGLFDFDRYNRIKGICGYISVEKLTFLSKRKSSLFERIRNVSYERVERFPSPTRELTKTLIFGERKELKGYIESFQDLGLIHILAVSGIHFAIFVGTSFLILKWLLRFPYLIHPTPIPITPDKIAYILSLAAIPLLLVMTGYPPSAIRAASMYIAYIPRIIFERDVSLLKALILGIVIVAIVEPSNIWEIGFLLSASAILGIVISNELLKGKSKLTKTIFFPITMSIVMTPLIAFFFGRIYLFSPIANLAVPFFSFIIFMNFLHFILEPFIPNFLSKLVNLINYTTLEIMEHLRNTNLVKGSIIYATKTLTVLSLIPLIAVLSLIPKNRKFRVLILALIVPTLIYATSIHRVNSKEKVVAFDFGETTVTLVKEDNLNLLFIGNLRNRDITEKILKALLYQDVYRVDGIYEIGDTNDNGLMKKLKSLLLKDGSLQRDEKFDNCHYRTKIVEFICNMDRCENFVCQDPWGNLKIGDRIFSLDKTGAIILEESDEKGIKWYKAYR
ncbi:MAG: ComEC/Rec2 family competence protein [Thermosulfidibacteraceae bacterium]